MFSSLIHCRHDTVRIAQPIEANAGKYVIYAQTVREFVVPVRVNVDTDWHAFVYSS